MKEIEAMNENHSAYQDNPKPANIKWKYVCVDYIFDSKNSIWLDQNYK